MPFVRLRRSLGIGRGEFASRGSVTQHCDNMAAACNVPCRKKTESMSPSETQLVIRRPITECIVASLPNQQRRRCPDFHDIQVKAGWRFCHACLCADLILIPPPRTPPTPRAATIAFFDLNATAPGSAITSLTVASRGAYGLAFTRLKNSPEVSKLNIGPNVTTVKVFWKLDSLVLTVAPSPRSATCGAAAIPTTVAVTRYPSSTRKRMASEAVASARFNE